MSGLVTLRSLYALLSVCALIGAAVFFGAEHGAVTAQEPARTGAPEVGGEGPDFLALLQAATYPNGPNMNVPVVKDVPEIPFESTTSFLKITPDMNFGEVLSVAVNSKGTIVVLNHPGTATSGPLYANATAQLLQFDSTWKFTREIGKGVYEPVTATPSDSIATTTSGSWTRGRTPSSDSLPPGSWR
jgi:hypothetical protein